jgi:hypothetical protein
VTSRVGSWRRGRRNMKSGRRRDGCLWLEVNHIEISVSCTTSCSYLTCNYFAYGEAHLTPWSAVKPSVDTRPLLRELNPLYVIS